MKHTKISISLLCILTYLGLHMNTYAQSSSNGTFLLELEQTTPTPVTNMAPSPVSKNPTQTVPTTTGISFAEQFLSFGFLIPGEPVLRNDMLTLHTTNNHGVTLFLMQNKPLSAEPNSITDTSCDTGSCTSTHASVWLSPLTFGFGVRCENSHGCTSDFSEPETFRPLSTTPAAFVKTNTTLQNVTLQYKLNIPASQPPLPYSNIVSYILVPNL